MTTINWGKCYERKESMSLRYIKKEVREGLPEEVKLTMRFSGWKGVSDIKEVRNRQISTCKGRKRKWRKTCGAGDRAERGMVGDDAGDQVMIGPCRP